MYNEQEHAKVHSLRIKRRVVAIVPAVLVLATALAIFIVGRIHRSEDAWKLTAALTVVGLSYLVFMLGVYVRPVACYDKHIGFMLHGRQHFTTGLLKEVGDNLCERGGVNCYPIMINVGDKDDGKDDRLFYFDALKEWPNIPLGSRITIQHNDIMVSDFRLEK